MIRADRATQRPGRIQGRRAGAARRTVGALTAAAVMLAACGGDDAVLGTDVAAPVVTTTTTTVPPTTTTTIDFDRPIIQTEIPLIIDATPADVATLVQEIRGQTADVDAQVRRLAPFPSLTEPGVAQIMDIAVALAPLDGESYPSTARVRFRSPLDGPAMVSALTGDLRAAGWNKTSEVSDTDGESTSHEMLWGEIGATSDQVELRVVIDGKPDLSIVDLEFSVLAEPEAAAPEDGVAYFDRLSSWDSTLPVPRTADLIEAAIETSPDAGAVILRYLLPAGDEADAVAQVVASIGSTGFGLANGGDAPTAGPLQLIDETGSTAVIEFSPAAEPDLVIFEVIVSFDLTPLD